MIRIEHIFNTKINRIFYNEVWVLFDELDTAVALSPDVRALIQAFNSARTAA